MGQRASKQVVGEAARYAARRTVPRAAATTEAEEAAARASATAAAMASRKVPVELEASAASNPLLHAKDPGLVKGLADLAGERASGDMPLDTIQSQPHEESQRELLRYYESQMAARQQPLPAPSSEVVGDRSKLVADSSVEHQLVLSDNRSDAELLDDTDLGTIFRLHRDDPETWDATALAKEFKCDEAMLAAVLESVTLPVLVKHDNEMYGVWKVI